MRNEPRAYGGALTMSDAVEWQIAEGISDGRGPTLERVLANIERGDHTAPEKRLLRAAAFEDWQALTAEEKNRLDPEHKSFWRTLRPPDGLPVRVRQDWFPRNYPTEADFQRGRG